MPSESQASDSNNAAGGSFGQDQANSADAGRIRHYVTPLMPVEQQVGLHVIGALQQEHTVAVLTTVVPGSDGGQNIISVGLNEMLLDQVQALLAGACHAESPRVPCIGFHCFLPTSSCPDKEAD